MPGRSTHPIHRSFPSQEPLKVSLLGVEPVNPACRIIDGRAFRGGEAREVVIDRNVALRSGIKVGDEIEIRPPGHGG